MSNLPQFNRRSLLKGAGFGAAVVGGSMLLSSCGGLRGSSGGAGGSDVLKIGLVSPRTGPLASFAEPDEFVIKHVTEALRNGFTAGGMKRRVEIIVKDTQSSPTRATEVTKQMITSDGVDFIIASGTPDTANPVSDQCEADGIPHATTIVPWESWYYGRGGEPGGQTFKYGANFYAGLGDMGDTFIGMFDRLDTNRRVGSLWPDDTDGNAVRSGFANALPVAGFDVSDGGSYQNGASDFTPQIAKFKDAGTELFTGIPIPPDFQNFWRQAQQQNYRPQLAAIMKSMLFPAEAEALGPLANNIATLGWWLPTFPYESSIDGTSAKDLAAAFTSDTGKQWSQALGSLYSLFEVAVECFKGADDPKDRDDVANQLQNLKYTGISGELDFSSGPERGVAIQRCAGIQWRPGTDFEWDLVVVDNTTRPDIPIGGDLEPTNA